MFQTFERSLCLGTFMHVERLAASQLTPEMVSKWAEFQADDPVLHSPFLRPEFTQAVAAVRRDVEVAVMYEGSEIIGFLPDQRSRWNVGQPVGSHLSDRQAVIARRGTTWSAEAIIRACGLAAWDYYQLAAEQTAMEGHHAQVDEAVYMNLENGYEAYERGRRAAGSEKFKQLGKLKRRAEREIGPVRFELHDEQRDVLEHLLAWKSAQYRATGATDVFALDWVVRLLQHVIAERDDDFRGLLSALYIGERLAAVELGLRSGSVLHGWFPAYSRDFAFYSPGLLLTVELAKVAPEHGITRLDLGRNNLPYKSSFASDRYYVARGSVAVRPLASLSRKLVTNMRRLSTETWLKRPTRSLRDAVRPIARWMALK